MEPAEAPPRPKASEARGGLPHRGRRAGALVASRAGTSRSRSRAGRPTGRPTGRPPVFTLTVSGPQQFVGTLIVAPKAAQLHGHTLTPTTGEEGRQQAQVANMGTGRTLTDQDKEQEPAHTFYARGSTLFGQVRLAASPQWTPPRLGALCSWLTTGVLGRILGGHAPPRRRCHLQQSHPRLAACPFPQGGTECVLRRGHPLLHDCMPTALCLCLRLTRTRMTRRTRWCRWWTCPTAVLLACT